MRLTFIKFYACLLICTGILPVYARQNNVPYYCPTVREAANTFDIKTSLYGKDVHWQIIKNKSFKRNDRPVGFIEAVLMKNDNESHDMTITCVYRTNENNRFIIHPLPSFAYSVDGVVDEQLGDYWYKNGNYLVCKESIEKCAFMFR